MKLKLYQRATFRAYNGMIVSGKIMCVTQHCYLVKSDTDFCTMFSDGLFRFTDYHLIKMDEGNSKWKQ